MKRYALIIGRFQPLHIGHMSLIQSVLDEGKDVCIAMMDTDKDERNPYSFDERVEMIRKVFKDESRVKIASIPPIMEVCYGRTPGFWVRRVYHGKETESISASGIRGGKEHADHFYDPEFIESFNCMAEKVHECAVDEGFWIEGTNRNFGEMVALVHSELSEALECARMGNPSDKNISEMGGVEVQLSDAIGYLMDMAVGYGFNLAEALLRKQKFNESRGLKHGGKEF